MRISTIDTENRISVRQFIQFPFELYEECDLWVPPFYSDVAMRMNRKKYPYYEHSDAAFFIAEDQSRLVGRIAILQKNKHILSHGEKTAFFYFYDSIENEEVTAQLLRAGEAWARERGLDSLVGPIGFLTGDGIGVLVEGFEHRPAMNIPYNFNYYDGLLKSAGYKKKTDYYSGYLPGDYELSDRFYTIANRVKEKRGFWIKSFASKRELRKWIPRIQEVYNKTFTDNFSYSPVSQREFQLVADRFMAAADPRFIKIVMKGEIVIGFLFVFIDVSDAIKKTGGKVWPFGWITLLRESKRAQWINFNGVGLLPGFRGVGANAVLYTEMADTVHRLGFAHADIVQIEEQNVKSMGDMAAIGVRWYKTHRVYEKKLT